MGKRLQIRNHAEVFDTRDSALAYINDIYKGQSLVAEPTVYLYGSALNPNIILAIGSVGNGSLAAKNKVFLIDTARLDKYADTKAGLISNLFTLPAMGVSEYLGQKNLMDAAQLSGRYKFKTDPKNRFKRIVAVKKDEE